jgi:hypothetical protein
MCILLAAMIAGHRNEGKKLATFAIALFLLMVVIAVIVSSRKTTAPAKEPPLHPSTLMFAEF